MADVCPVCSSSDLLEFAKFPDLPALANALWPTVDEASKAARGDVTLALCRTCATIANTSFDVSVFGYSPAYENALHFSATFRDFAQGVAERLVQRYGLQAKRLLEIGPGDGTFLQTLCDLGGSTGVGFDPSFPEDVPRVRDLSEQVQVRREHFPVDGEMAADFVCARHVLEHVPDPVPMVESMRRAVDAAGGSIYVEVPDAGFMLDELALWDVIYEHCLYFTSAGMQAMLESVGFEINEIDSSFGGQFLYAEANASAPNQAGPSADAVAAIEASALSFHDRATALVATANDTLATLSGQGRVALWGAGSKGVSFLNMTDARTLIDRVVDINPRKHGKFVPVSGQEVVSPESLVDDPPAAVIVLNKNYIGEIGSQLESLGVSASIQVIEPPF